MKKEDESVLKEETKNKTVKNASKTASKTASKKVSTRVPKVKIEKEKKENQKTEVPKLKKENVQKFTVERKEKKENILNKISNIDKRIWYALAAIILLVIVIYIGIRMYKASYGNKFKIYEEKMVIYGMDSIYDNQSCKSTEFTTKSEALKMAIATVFNTSDISGFAISYDNYPNQTWVEYAKELGIIEEDEINASNYNDNVRYSDVVKYFERAKDIFTEIETKTTNTIVLANSGSYDAEINIAFSDFVEAGIIKVDIEDIDGKRETLKGQVNELVVNFLEQYNLISADQSSRLRFTDMPKTADEYPYILFDNESKVYDYARIITSEGNDMTSKQLYKSQKQNMLQAKECVEGYLNTILNVDYETINEEDYCSEIDKFIIYTSYTENTNNYINYVKENHIKLEASATFIEPCLYLDGANYRARVKLNLKILNADTRENLLYNDLVSDKNYTYNDSEYIIYLDIPLTNALNSTRMYVSERTLMDNVINPEDLNITSALKEISNPEPEYLEDEEVQVIEPVGEITAVEDEDYDTFDETEYEEQYTEIYNDVTVDYDEDDTDVVIENEE